MSITGWQEHGPLRVGIPIADVTAGLFCAIGILVALLEREVSGEGQWVQSSLLEAQITMLEYQAAKWLIEKRAPGQEGNDHPSTYPCGTFRTADGHINLCAAGDWIYGRFCKALKADHLTTDPKYATDPLRHQNRASMKKDIEAITVTRPSAYWVESLNDAGVPCGPIYRIEEVFADPQVQALGMSAGRTPDPRSDRDAPPGNQS